MPHPNNNNGPKGIEAIEGMISGLTGILGKLGDLAEAGEKLQQMQQDGNLKSPSGKPFRIQYGLNIKSASDGTGEIEIEPFGDVKQDNTTGEATVNEVREPPVDLFEEDDHILVIIEMPGISMEEAQLNLNGDVLQLSASNGTKQYGKEILLPENIDPASMSTAANNGIFEIRFNRAA